MSRDQEKKEFETKDPIPTRASVRKFLFLTFPLSSDYEAFCLERFPEVHREFASDQTRTQRMNILLEKIDTQLILESLKQYRPDAFYQHSKDIKYMSRLKIRNRLLGSPRDRFLANLQRRLEERWSSALRDLPYLPLRIEISRPNDNTSVSGTNSTQQHGMSSKIEYLDLTETYLDADGIMIILGKPGAGKSLLILDLIRKLAENACKDRTSPLPFLLDLSSWTQKRKNLVQWIQDEGRLEYRVPKKIIGKWIESGELIILLDGIDEVRAEDRESCAKAISEFIEKETPAGIVLTSRVKEYENLQNKPNMHMELRIQDLTNCDIAKFLEDNSAQFVELKTFLDSHPSTIELLQQPLALRLLADSVKKKSEVPEITAEDPMRQIVDIFAKSSLQSIRPLQANTEKFIIQFATKTNMSNNVSFYVERLQPNWLSPSARLAYRLLVILGLLLMYFPIFAIAAMSPFLNDGLLHVILDKDGSVANNALLEQYRNTSIAASVMFSFLFILVFSIYQSISAIKPTDNIGFKFSGKVFSLLFFIWNMRAVTMITALPVVPFFYLAYLFFGPMPEFGFLAVLLLAGPISAPLAFTFMTWAVFSSQEIPDERRIVPNQGIRSSIKNTLLAIFVYSFVTALIMASSKIVDFMVSSRDTHILSKIWGNDNTDITFAFFSIVVLIICMGILSSPLYGAAAIIKHYILRFLLIIDKVTPPRFVRFLNTCADSGLLRQVNGGYVFTHRIIQSYLAKVI